MEDSLALGIPLSNRFVRGKSVTISCQFHGFPPQTNLKCATASSYALQILTYLIDYRRKRAMRITPSLAVEQLLLEGDPAVTLLAVIVDETETDSTFAIK